MKRIILLLQLLILTAALIALSSCSNRQSLGSANAPFAPRMALQTHLPQPQHIALLLPLTGSYAAYATAIRNGFFTAYYDQKARTGFAPTITVFNTDGKNIRDVYQTAVTEGADFVVGPLDKSDVLALADAHKSNVPVLALNKTPANLRIDNNALYEFSLSPTDEAHQDAIKAWNDHHHNIIILAPNNAWGQRLATAFTDQWKAMGGTIIATEYYGNMASLSKSIQTVLQISHASQNDRHLKQLFHEDIRFIPDRRQDFDSIFLVATPEMGRQIKPLLNFYFAQNIPVYATSQIYSGNPNANRDNDLDGILFCDMPWILTSNQMQPAYLQSIAQHIQALWPNNYAHLARFYAMGVDAFDLTLQMNQLASGMPAATGTLFLTQQHDIYRQLTWAQFQNGIPQLVN